MLNLKLAARNTNAFAWLCTGVAVFALSACAERAGPTTVGPGRIVIGPNNGGPTSPNAQNGFETYSCLTFRSAAESMIHADQMAAEETFAKNQEANSATMDAILKELEAEQATLAKIRKLSKKIKKSGTAKVASDPIARKEFEMIRDSLGQVASRALGKIKDKTGQTLVSCTTPSAVDSDDEEDTTVGTPAVPTKKLASDGIVGVTDFDIVCNTGNASNPRISFVAFDKQANAAALSVSYSGREPSKLQMADHRFEVETPSEIWYRFKKKSGFSVPTSKDGRPSKLPIYILRDLDTLKTYAWTLPTDAQFKREVENVVAPQGCNK